MTSKLLLGDLNSDSSDSDDCDYVPTNVDVSDISVEEDEIDTDEDNSGKTKPTKRINKRNSKKVKKKVEDESIVSPPVKIAEDDKKRANDLWKEFLSDVDKESTQNKSSVSKSSGLGSLASSPDIPASIKTPEKKTVTEYFEFAGEIVPVKKEITADESLIVPSERHSAENSEVSNCENIKTTKSVASGSSPVVLKRKGGLNSVIGNILNKKQKITTLQKTLLDWKSFKQEEGLEEELAQHNRGKDGFLEKKAFLQRTDFRSYEAEKSARLNKKK